MNWLLFILLGYAAMVLQVGLGSLLQVGTGFGPVQPRLELIVVAAAALAAPTRLSTAAAFGLGLAIDLLIKHEGGAVVVGPFAFGFAAAAAVVGQFRAALMRNHPMSMAVAVLAAGAAWALVVAGVWALRAAIVNHPASFSALADLMTRLLGTGYSAALMLVLALPRPIRRAFAALGGSPGGRGPGR